MASKVPARLLGLEQRAGDVVVFDPDMAVVSTSIGGTTVWER
jgi:hypothetical protein